MTGVQTCALPISALSEHIIEDATVQTNEQNPMLIVLKRGGISDDCQASIPTIAPTYHGAPSLVAVASLATVASTESKV